MSYFKPMKGDDADLSRLVFPYMVTPKIDGHRCIIKDGVAYTSAMKPFPNEYVQRYFSGGQYDGLDGELVVGSANHPDVFKNTSSGVRRAHGEPDFIFHVFDCWDDEMVDCVTGKRSGFMEAGGRFDWLVEQAERGMYEQTRIQIVPMTLVTSMLQLEALEAAYLAEGYEGVMLRHPGSPYKRGRSTVRENFLLKLKRFADAEAEIVGFVEQMKNNNVATTNELGRTKRSSAKAGKVGKGTLGALVVRALNGKYAGVEFEIGTGLDDTYRRSIWGAQDWYRGKVITFKYQDIGSYEKPRIPVFKGFRDRDELSS